MRQIVAALVLHEDYVCLLRRSQNVGSDVGLWHCVTGFLDPGSDPEKQIQTELYEEIGATPEDFGLNFVDSTHIEEWNVHLFEVHLRVPLVQINWEHDAYDWVRKEDLGSFSTVWWLRRLVDMTAI